ncbi:MAG: signal peptidase I [Gammaproteobacteria bacterium]|nr:signal peptidase I [Gammaproteobacteria bacterium]
MTFDFSTLLVALTLASGGIWALDSWLLKPRRQARAGAGTSGDTEPVWVEYARSFFPVFLIVLLLRSFLVEPFRIPSASMMPTLLIGDFILVNKFEYGIRLPVVNVKIISNRPPRRGEVIVFRYPEDPDIPFIKRVVGLPGDLIVYRDKTLYVNGEPMAQSGLGEYRATGSGASMDGTEWQEERLGEVPHGILSDPGRPALDLETVVPENQYFVLGDNRDNSRDSRFWGFVPDANLIGRAFLIWMNWDRKNGGIEWSRIGTIIQ